jgi:sugar lactone lactonase YvrE
MSLSPNSADAILVTTNITVPHGMVFGWDSKLYVCGSEDDTVFVMNRDGTDKRNFSGPADGWRYPDAVVLDTNGNFIVSDPRNHRLRKITPAGVVTTILGGTEGDQNGPVTEAKVNIPVGVDIDPKTGDIYFADLINKKIKRISNGIVETIAGTGIQGVANGNALKEAQFDAPNRIAWHPSGTLFITEFNFNRVRALYKGHVYDVIGSIAGNEVGSKETARLNRPFGIKVDTAGNLVVADSGNNQLVRINFNENK